ncbi:hypothetical protein ACFYY8_31420 [Streptosporangium sp. NPDC001559]|uniref:hypothetical protein n=1 Tax=Streptosporangium sp. NPDC001559 TaxID=3366187 RepID=UPI0036E55B9F
MATPDANQAAVDAVLAHEWRPSSPRTAHRDHTYDAECAVCQKDVAAVVAVALQAVVPVLDEEARDGERDAIVAAIRYFFAAVDDDLYGDVRTLCGRLERGEHRPARGLLTVQDVLRAVIARARAEERQKVAERALNGALPADMAECRIAPATAVRGGRTPVRRSPT